MKQGIKTSEFWLTAVVILIGLAIESGIFPETSGTMKILVFISQALSAMGYSYGRSLVKANNPDDGFDYPPDVEE